MFTREYDEFGPQFGGFAGGFRAGRGMMEPAILSALAERPMHGYEIISYLEEKSHGVWRPSPGSVYPTLQLLEEKELIEHTKQADKKTYQLTSQGKEQAEASSELCAAHLARFGDIDRHEGRRMNLRHDYQRQFHKEMGGIIKQMRYVFRKGTKGQKDAMSEAISEFKTRMDTIVKGE